MSKSLEATKPFCFRLTDRQRSELEGRARGRALGGYVKSVLFADSPLPSPASVRTVPGDRQQLARLLAMLGASRLASNFNQIAKAANQGALPVTEELEADLRAACREIAEMRVLLCRALGIQATDQKPPVELTQTFNRSAGAAR